MLSSQKYQTKLKTDLIKTVKHKHKHKHKLRLKTQTTKQTFIFNFFKMRQTKLNRHVQVFFRDQVRNKCYNEPAFCPPAYTSQLQVMTTNDVQVVYSRSCEFCRSALCLPQSTVQIPAINKCIFPGFFDVFWVLEMLQLLEQLMSFETLQ